MHQTLEHEAAPSTNTIVKASAQLTSWITAFSGQSKMLMSSPTSVDGQSYSTYINFGGHEYTGALDIPLPLSFFDVYAFCF